MTKIEIICGTYGYRPDGSKHPIPIDRGGICEVSEEEAQRLFCPVCRPPRRGNALSRCCNAPYWRGRQRGWR